MAYHVNGISIICATDFSGQQQRKHHPKVYEEKLTTGAGPVDNRIGPLMRKTFPYRDIFMSKLPYLHLNFDNHFTHFEWW